MFRKISLERLKEIVGVYIVEKDFTFKRTYRERYYNAAGVTLRDDAKLEYINDLAVEDGILIRIIVINNVHDSGLSNLLVGIHYPHSKTIERNVEYEL